LGIECDLDEPTERRQYWPVINAMQDYQRSAYREDTVMSNVYGAQATAEGFGMAYLFFEGARIYGPPALARVGSSLGLGGAAGQQVQQRASLTPQQNQYSMDVAYNILSRRQTQSSLQAVYAHRLAVGDQRGATRVLAMIDQVEAELGILLDQLLNIGR
jgi:hypothetical protein